jgi:hypothetical protein
MWREGRERSSAIGGVSCQPLGDAERHGMHSHAEHGNDRTSCDAHAVLFPAEAGPTKSTRCLVGPASAGKLLPLIFLRKKLKHHKTRLGCRPNADDAEWAERHGCRESAVRTWMSVRRGPTERRRSEGIPTKEEPNQEQAPLVTWGAFPSNSPKAKRSAVRQMLLILTSATPHLIRIYKPYLNLY